MSLDHWDPMTTSHLSRREVDAMTNEALIRQACAVAEVEDVPAWVACSNPEGVFVDMSVGVTHQLHMLRSVTGLGSVMGTTAARLIPRLASTSPAETRGDPQMAELPGS
jgi:hypothetical protein